MDILALPLPADGEEGAIAAAADLANMGEGRARALLFEIGPRPFDPPDGFMTPEVRSQMSERAHKAFVQEDATAPPLLMAH